MVNVYSKKCIVDGCTKQVSYGNNGAGNGKFCGRHAVQEKAKILDTSQERAPGQGSVGHQLIDGAVGSVDGERTRKRSHPSNASSGANGAVGPNDGVCARTTPEATTQPPVSKRPATGTSSGFDEAEAGAKQKGCPEPPKDVGVSLGADAATNTPSSGINAADVSCSSRGGALGSSTSSFSQQAMAENASRPSSPSPIASSSDDGGSVRSAAAAITDRSNGDDGGGRAETDSSRSKAATPDTQRGGTAASAPRKTAKMSVVKLASLVLEAWAEGGEEEEGDDDDDEGLRPRLASAKKAAAVNFVNAAATVLGMAKVSEKNKL